MANRSLRRTTATTLVGLALAVGTAVAGTGIVAAQDGSLDRVKDEGLYIAFVGENPWSYLAPDGTFTGAEAEMAKECAASLGIEEVFPVNVQFDGLLPGLAARRFDMIAAGMSGRPSRLEVANSTQLLYRYGTRIVGMEGDPVLDELTSWTAVGESGIPVAMIRGSTEITDTEPFGVEVVEYADNPSELADLLAGRIQLMAWNDNYFSSFVAENPDVPIQAVEGWDYEGVVSLPVHYFNQEDLELRDAFNDCYSDLKNSGRMAEILSEFGFNPDTIPPPSGGYPPGSPEDVE